MSFRKPSADPTYGRRRKIVGVMGSGVDPYAELASAAGQSIARIGCHLLTGGGAGVMEAVSRAFSETTPREGVVIGVIRADGDAHLAPIDGRRDYRRRGLNPHVEIPVFTHLPASSTESLSRNHINVLTSDVVLVLPGGSGTLSELELAAQYAWTPVLLFLGRHRVGGLTADEIVAQKHADAGLVEDEGDLERELRAALGI
ncbi:MAG: hypothetical protein R3174_02335 [Gammaproteobacteria bacterium]|nr:hypothetical protein [Gammaproteobacteria bacterium]